MCAVDTCAVVAVILKLLAYNIETYATEGGLVLKPILLAPDSIEINIKDVTITGYTEAL